MGAALCQSAAGEEHSLVMGLPQGLPHPCLLLECRPGALLVLHSGQWHLNWLPRALAAAITAFGSVSLPCCAGTFQGCALVPSPCEGWSRKAGMAAGLLVPVPAWADRSTWLWHLLDGHSPSQKHGGQQGRASSRHGCSVPQAEPRGCQDVSLTHLTHWQGVQSQSAAHRKFLTPAKLR